MTCYVSSGTFNPTLTQYHYDVDMSVYTADVDALDMYGVSAMHLAAENGHLTCLQALLEAGADYNTGTAEKKPQWVSTTGQ